MWRYADRVSRNQRHRLPAGVDEAGYDPPHRDIAWVVEFRLKLRDDSRL
jgi:hypothetical protein